MIDYRYDTQLLIEGEGLDEDAINDYFVNNFKGDCLIDVGDEELIKTVKQQIRQLQNEIVGAKAYVNHCETELDEFRLRLRSQERRVNDCERAAENYKARIDQFIAWRDALLDNLKKAQTAYDDACKAYEEAKAAADKATSPEITQPTETTPPSGSAQPAETAQPASSSATATCAA